MEGGGGGQRGRGEGGVVWCGEECGVANKMPHGAHMVRETIAVRPKKNGF